MSRVEPGITERVAAWATALRYEDIPEVVLERARLQVASVLAAIVATSRTEMHPRLLRAAARWGSGTEATIIPSGPRSTLHAACYVNAAASVAYDFDDYLFAGHTGHSAVVGALAFAEALGLDGRAMIATQVAANEIAGRLGAAALLGPHNGQMWAYIHNIAGAVVAGRSLGVHVEEMQNAIGLALAQPPYPLAAGFFGPDSKAVLAAGPLVDGIRAAELAAEGLTGARDVLEGDGGFLKSIPRKPLSFVFDALGSAWVTQSLAFKTIPGCAYIDTPAEALEEIKAAFAEKHGRALAPADVGSIRVEATLFTNGMEKMSTPHRGTEMRAIDVNFSVKLSFGVLIAAGEISVEALQPAALSARLSEITAIARKVTLKQSVPMNLKMSGLSEIGINTIRLVDPTYKPTLDGADFGKYEMRFPARVALQTSSGEEYTAEVDAPVGAPGRPLEETTEAVRQKFLRASRGVLADPQTALEAALGIDKEGDVARLVSLMSAS
ncbi:MAG TPA: MmgE/PrpD family protein [Actinomycetota bacterium]|nr:MmgE/PrpD family protein [Actinomycetota bacterium]